MSRNSQFLVAILATLLLPVAADAVIITETLTAVADVNTKYNAPTSNGTSIHLKNNGGESNTRKGYVRFDVSGIDISSVVDATYTVTLSGNAPGNDTLYVYGHRDAVPTNVHGRVGDVAWTEAQLVALPDEDAPANSFDGSGSHVGNGFNAVGFHGSHVTPTNTPLGTVAMSTSDSAGDQYTIDTTNLLDFVTADTNGTLTFMMYVDPQQSNNNYFFASLQNGTYTAPQLTLSIFQAVPEPTTLTLAGLGLFGLAFQRRRRLR